MIISFIVMSCYYYIVNGFSQVSKAVITVPAHYTHVQRQATRRAAEMVGLTVVAMLNEPTSAALAFALNKKHKVSPLFHLSSSRDTFTYRV